MPRQSKCKKKKGKEGEKGKSIQPTLFDSLKKSTPKTMSATKRDHFFSKCVLEDFDWDPKYGPCMGITRSDRYNRAIKLGLNPPLKVKYCLLGKQSVLRGEETEEDSEQDAGIDIKSQYDQSFFDKYCH